MLHLVSINKETLDTNERQRGKSSEIKLVLILIVYRCKIYFSVTVFRNDMIDLLGLFVLGAILDDGINN